MKNYNRHIYLSCFLSSTSSSPAIKEYSGEINTWSGNADTRGIGNVLVIDDVHLEYAK